MNWEDDFNHLNTKELLEHVSLLAENTSVINETEFYAGLLELEKRINSSCWKDVLVAGCVSMFFVLIYALWVLLTLFPIYSLTFILYVLGIILPLTIFLALCFYKSCYVLKLNFQLINLLMIKREGTRKLLVNIQNEHNNKDITNH